jgi:vitamin B12 transporter
MQCSIKFLGFSLLVGYSLFANDELEPMVVVETRTPQPLSEASPWVTRISGDELEQRQIYNLSDALRSVPGMAVVRAGQMGVQTSLFSRGGESNHVAFLYEGRRLNGGFSGTYNLGELSTLGSSSIEVLKGSSSINGANAMGGTVHMRNELPLSDGHDSKAGFSYGSFDTLNSNFSTRFKNGNWAGNFSFSSLDTENDRPHSKFESLSSSFFIENQLTDGLSVNLLGLGYDNYLGSNFNKTYSVSPIYYQETEHFLISPQLKVQTDAWDASVHYSFSEHELNYTPSYNMLYWTEQENVDFFSEYFLTDQSSFQSGLGYSTSRFFREGIYLNSWEQSFASLGLKHEISKDTELNGNIRFCDYSDFGSSETYDLKLNKSISENLSIYAKFSTGFTPPEALDLYKYGDGYPGNPDLVAEEARNYEVGFSHNDHTRRHAMNISLFFTEFKNLIDAPWGKIPKNILNSESFGIEFSTQNQVTERLSLSSSVTYLRSNQQGLDDKKDFLRRRPEFFGSVTAEYELKKIILGTQMNFRNNAKEDETTEMDDYATFRLLGNYEISDHLVFNARVENLFDENYEEVVDYPALGRAIHAGFTYNF